MRGFVGIDGAAGRDACATIVTTDCIFGLEHEGQRPAVALAHDDHDAALAGLVLGKATVDAILLAVGRATWPPK